MKRLYALIITMAFSLIATLALAISPQATSPSGWLKPIAGVEIPNQDAQRTIYKDANGNTNSFDVEMSLWTNPQPAIKIKAVLLEGTPTSGSIYVSACGSSISNLSLWDISQGNGTFQTGAVPSDCKVLTFQMDSGCPNGVTVKVTYLTVEDVPIIQ
jgi:hypothetical protein